MEQPRIQRILTRMLPSRSWKLTAETNGMNNTTCQVEADGKRYILRIYETHQDEEKVRYEHHVLQALQRSSLPFSVPAPAAPPLRTEDGELAALFYWLPGRNPSLAQAGELYSYGQAVGHITQALAELEMAHPPVYRPYYDIWHAHPRCPLPAVLAFCQQPPAAFAELEAELTELAAALQLFDEHVPQLKQLPHQLVHGDINASNVLANEAGKITAVLDFEFVTRDIRVMELAVCLADFIRPGAADAEIWRRMNAFMDGYRSVLVLKEEEIAEVPVLILLRSLDVFLHFLGRYWDGKSGAAVVKQQVAQAVQRAQWLEKNRTRLTAVCRAGAC